MLLESWEIRWFGEGAVPLALQQWSEENNLLIQPLRTDHYLMHNGGEKVGIKWREGNLQIKELVESSAGKPKLEHYKKWSFELKRDDLLSKIEADAEWIAVTKKRDLAKWKISGDKFERIEPGSEEDNACEMEISAVMCKEKLWWTVAFEANGGKEILLKTLKNIEVPLKDNAALMGYAEWLDKNFSNGN